MSPQDSQLLQDFLHQLVQARGVAKDADAEAMINRAVSQQPDAAYLLVQRALLQQQALDNAKAEIAALQGQLRSGTQGSGSFLDPNAWGSSGTSRPASTVQQAPAGAPYPQQYQQPYPPNHQGWPQPQSPAGSGGFLRGGMGGGLLGNIAATAAGVAGGAFLFQGLEHLLGHHAGNGFLGPQTALTSPQETTTVNNYYDSNTSSNEQLADKLGGNSLSDLTGDSAVDNGSASADNFLSDMDSTMDGNPDDDLFT